MFPNKIKLLSDLLNYFYFFFYRCLSKDSVYFHLFMKIIAALFQSLLYEACGRTINPVNGAVGLLWSGNWHVCQAAVDTVLAGGVIQPFPEVMTPVFDESSHTMSTQLPRTLPVPILDPSRIPEYSHFNKTSLEASRRRSGDSTPLALSLVSGESEMTSYDGICSRSQKKLLNLFVWEKSQITRYSILS